MKHHRLALAGLCLALLLTACAPVGGESAPPAESTAADTGDSPIPETGAPASPPQPASPSVQPTDPAQLESAAPSARPGESAAPAVRPAPVWGTQGWSHTYTAEDGTVLLELAYELPYIENAGDWPAYEAINRYFAEQVPAIGSAQEALEWAEGDYAAAPDQWQTPYADGITCQVVPVSGRLVSLVWTLYNQFGGVHPNSFLSSAMFDLETGEQVGFAELFTVDEETARQRLLELMRESELYQELPEAQGADGLFATLEEAFSPDQCYRTPEGLAVYYQTYSVGPYAVGTPTFVISADQLGEMLRAWD
mgnify:CR=1 FL=1